MGEKNHATCEMTNRLRILSWAALVVVLLLLTACSVSTGTATEPAQPASGTHTRQPTSTRVPPTLPVPADTSTPTEAPAPTPSLATFPLAPADPGDEPAGIDEVIGGLSNLPFDQFIEDSYHQLLLRDPDHLFINGAADSFGIANNRFSNISPAFLMETATLEEAVSELLHVYDYAALTPDQQLTYDIYDWVLDDRIRGHAFMFHDFPVNTLTIWGVQNWILDFMQRYQPIGNGGDAENYLARLGEMDEWVSQLLEGLELRSEMGIIPPKYILEGSIQQIDENFGLQSGEVGSAGAVSLYTNFLNQIGPLDDLDTQEKQVMRDSARDLIESSVMPAFLDLRGYLDSLVPLAPDDGGTWTLPDGEAYYDYSLRHHTESDLVPEEVHQLGLSELRRVQQEIRSEAAALGLSVGELDAYIAETSPPLRGKALFDEIERLASMAELASGDTFDVYPQSDLVVEQEPFGSLAYYLPPSYEGVGPGRFFVNLDSPLPSYMLPALVYHETIPGHHVQGALARELDIPTFRKDIEFNAYMEGWALYAERLAWEMGLYEDPLSNIGRLQFEEMRALRLVVDSGVHAMGWTHEETAEKVEQLTGSPINQGYLTRFYVLPGQASGYTIGMLKILELRQRAMDQLGEEFDLREFHNVIIGNGPMPLDILEKVVDDWIQSRSSGP